MKLSSELKTKINKIAHAAGVDYGKKEKRRLIDEISSRMNAGANQDAMTAWLVSMTMTDADLAAMVLTDDELMARAFTQADLAAMTLDRSQTDPA